MTVETELPVREAPVHFTDPADAAELLRTMAAVVRTVFGVALQAPSTVRAEHPAEPSAAQVEAAPAPVAVPAEQPTLAAVPEAPAPMQVPVQMPTPVAQPAAIALSLVPDPEPAEALASIAMPSISLGEGSWSSPQDPAIVIPAYSLPEPLAAVPAPPAASLPMPGSIPVNSYVAPAAPEVPVVDRHNMALLHEIAFLDD